MGKVADRGRKQGRASHLDPQKISHRKQKQREETREGDNHPHKRNSNPNYRTTSITANRIRRSSRRSTNHGAYYADVLNAIVSDEEDDEFDCERREKKLNHVLKLPPQVSSFSCDSTISGSCEFESNPDEESAVRKAKKRRLDAIDNGSAHPNNSTKEDEEDDRISIEDTASLQEDNNTQLDFGPPTPLPDRKLLLSILDRLQKKDTYGAFSEPADVSELPDYKEIVESPMDFGTVRMKLSSGDYTSLHQFQRDVFLIASNAMLYNAQDTIYFRQARSIQEQAKMDFNHLRSNVLQPKLKRRGRPPKNAKKSIDCNWVSSDHHAVENTTTDRNEPAGPSSRTFNPEDRWKPAFPGSVPGKKKKKKKKEEENQTVIDENRRRSYAPPYPSFPGPFDGQKKQLLSVGLDRELGYAHSLARFAAGLGRTAWSIASKKIQRSLPAGVRFGPGWVGEEDGSVPPPTRPPDSGSTRPFIHRDHSDATQRSIDLNSL